jgi:hypothetical protein
MNIMKPNNILSFSSEKFYIIPEPKDLFDHRTNRRAHGKIGSNIRG